MSPDCYEQPHPLVRRILHWMMAISILVMSGSGWRIYNVSPISDFLTFPVQITLGGDVQASLARPGDPGVASAIAWHFAAMWTLAASYLLFVGWGVITGHFWRDFLPISPRSVWRDFIAALTFRLQHHLGAYNAVQKIAYVGVLGLVALMILSGLTMWKPVQTYPLELLFGGFQGARLVHFIVMAGIVVFLLVQPVSPSLYRVRCRPWFLAAPPNLAVRLCRRQFDDAGETRNTAYRLLTWRADFAGRL